MPCACIAWRAATAQTLIDLIDKLFRGETTGSTILSYFYFRTPQFFYYVIPMGVLVSTLPFARGTEWEDFMFWWNSRS
jgi:hypothetical protein